MTLVPEKVESARRPATAARRRRTWAAPTLPVLFTVALALIWHASIDARSLRHDALHYHSLAATLAGFAGDSGDAFEGMAARGWTHTALMALVFKAFGTTNHASYGVLQAVVLLPATVLLVYVAGRFAFGRLAGLVAAWGFALWFPLMYHTTWPLPETTVGLLSAAVLALTTAVIVTPRVWVAACLGVVLGLLALTHPAWQFLPLALIAALAAHLYFFSRASVRLAGFALLGLVAIVVPYTVVQMTTDLPRPGEGGPGLGYGGSWGVWVGSRSWTDFEPVPSDYVVAQVNQSDGVEELARRIRRGQLQTDERMRRLILAKAARGDEESAQVTDLDYLRTGLGNLLHEPGGWPRKVAHGVTTTFLPRSDLTLYEPPPVDQVWIRRPWRALAVPVALLMLAGLLLVAARRRDRLILAVPIVVQTAVFTLGTPEPRYGYPLMSSVMLFAAFAVLSLTEVGRQRYAREDCTTPRARSRTSASL